MRLVRYGGTPRIVVARTESFGLPSVDLAGLPRRLYGDQTHAPPLFEQYVDEAQAEPLLSAVDQLSLASDVNWLTRSSESLRRLHAMLLIGEDPQGRLTSRKAATLSHQISLVRHILNSPELQRVLIADEVGLGKTIEAGMVIQELLAQSPGSRILYLAPARLVKNVYREFRQKLDLQFRRWGAADTSYADIEIDQLVVASIHRAVHPANRNRLLAGPSWDILVVDEAHHLTATGARGQDANQHYQLVRELISKQPPNSRVMLLTGTPHQGNRRRFENILLLLTKQGETVKDGAERVVFRTKEDVRDWEGKRLFPKREVRQPYAIELGPEYRRWYNAISELYGTSKGSEASKRASSWARSQALQWAASSVQAGLGFLVRLAIRRKGWDLKHPGFTEALAALRPYRFGPSDEPLEQLLARIHKEIDRQLDDADLEDQEEVEEERWAPDDTFLSGLLSTGVSLVKRNVGAQKWAKVLELVTAAKGEKIVLFAQPIETVTALVNYFEQTLQERPAVIVGGQSDEEREKEISDFWNATGKRLLVSSRAGGEGINLQVARRLIHLDVPWNPMEMEQRVGRVHRFGSRRTILVDTVVAAETREVDAYRIARDKLKVVCGDLADDPERFETLYARVMSLVPPQEFESIVGGLPPQQILDDDANRLGELVAQGLERWEEFNRQFSGQQHTISNASPGTADWNDLLSFGKLHLGARDVSGFSVPTFIRDEDGESSTTSTPVDAIEIEGTTYACGESFGFPVSDAVGNIVQTIGINTPIIAERLRSAFQSDSGAAWLRLHPQQFQKVADIASVCGPLCFVVGFLRQTLRFAQGTAQELQVELRLYVLDADGSAYDEVAEPQRADVVRALIGGVRQKSPDLGKRPAQVSKASQQIWKELAMPSQEDMQTGIRYAVWPLFAAAIELAKGGD